ncbi:MAG: hypothetical protein RI946_1740 [Pseudomonadota bacterium]
MAVRAQGGQSVDGPIIKGGQGLCVGRIVFQRGLRHVCMMRHVD